MAQENDTDMSTKFSTLNVNATEFVPSFCVQQSTTTTAEETAAPTEVLAATTPENPGSYSFKPDWRTNIREQPQWPMLQRRLDETSFWAPWPRQSSTATALDHIAGLFV